MFLHFQRGRYLQVPADKFVETFHQAWYQSCFMRCTASPVSQAYSKKKHTKKIALLHLTPFWNAGVMNSFKIDAMKACVFWCLLKAEGMMRTSHTVYCPFPCFRNPVIKNLQLVTSDLFSYIGAESRQNFSLIYTRWVHSFGRHVDTCVLRDERTGSDKLGLIPGVNCPCRSLPRESRLWIQYNPKQSRHSWRRAAQFRR